MRPQEIGLVHALGPTGDVDEVKHLPLVQEGLDDVGISIQDDDLGSPHSGAVAPVTTRLPTYETPESCGLLF